MFIVFETTLLSGTVPNNLIGFHGTPSNGIMVGRRLGSESNMNSGVYLQYGSVNQLQGFEWGVPRTYIMYVDFNQSTIPSGEEFAIGSKLYDIEGVPFNPAQSSFSVYTSITAPGQAPGNLFVIGLVNYNSDGSFVSSHLKISYLSYSKETLSPYRITNEINKLSSQWN